MHRMTVQYARPDDVDAFERRYAEEHVPLVRRIPGLSGFRLSRPRAMSGEAPYLVAELDFQDADAFKAALRSPEMAQTAAHAEGAGVAMTLFSGEVVDVTA